MNAITRWTRAVADASAAFGRRVTIDPVTVLDRSSDLALGLPGLWSPNRSCRLVRTADSWLAVNLPRPDDLDLVPAWLGRDIAGDLWLALIRAARHRHASELLDGARLLGLAVTIVGETPSLEPAVPIHVLGDGRARARNAPRVVDLGVMWAGPLCAAILAEAGAEVTRFESSRRPDPSRTTTPDFHARLNARKAYVTLDFADAGDLSRLAAAIAAADVVVTSARPRAFEALGLRPETMMRHNPGLIWVAITGHGWTAPNADRIGFGDDAAAAGGLVRRTAAGNPRFVGDALADPLTGLAAAAATFDALGGRGGVLIDAALARVAADAAVDWAGTPV